MTRNKFNVDETLKKENEFKLKNLKRLGKYLLPYTKLFIVTIFLTLIGSLIKLIGPYIMKILIDTSIPNNNINEVLKLSFLFFASLCIAAVISKVNSNNMNKIGQSIIHNLRYDIFIHLQKLPFEYYDSRPHGKILIRVVNYINSLSELLSKGIINLITDLLSLVLIIGIMFIIDVRLTLASMSGLPILFLSIFLIKAKSRQAWQINSSKQSNLNAYIHESISGVKVVQSFARQQQNLKVFDEVNEDTSKAWLNACSISFLIEPAVINIATWTTVFIYVISVILIYDYSYVTAGVVVAFSSYILQFWSPITNIANVYGNIMVNMSYIERIFETIDEPIGITDKPHAKEMCSIKGDIEFKNVVFTYDQNKIILNNISFNHKAGSTIALVGPTGSGKTTIVNIISRFYNITSGKVLIDGIDISDVTINSLRKQMGILLQDNFIFSGTVMDNIRYGRLDATDEEVIEASKIINAHEFVMKMEHGYDTEVNERGSRLSIGERQLISFARVFLSNPKILILDEATSSIDTNTELMLQKSLDKLLKTRTSFIIAHRLSTIKNADCIMYIDNGQILESGSHDELMAKDKFYKQLINSQYNLLGNAL